MARRRGGAAFAGEFETVLDVHTDEMVREAIHTVRRSRHSERVLAYSRALGVLYVELLAPEPARQQLEAALNLARESRSQLHIHYTTGVLAWTHFLQGDITGAQTCLETVLSTDTPVDTMGSRYCWARRAELALAQGDPPLALDITDRLIASAPGMSPGRVITFLWKLKGEALNAMRHTEKAQLLLHAAIVNARTTGERFLLWRVHASLGRLYRATDRQSDAEKEFSKARELVEELAGTLPDGELRGPFVQRAHGRLSSST